MQCMEICLEIDPNYEPAQKALERLKESEKKAG